MTLQNLLKNPIYAGAYAYGRRAGRPARATAGAAEHRAASSSRRQPGWRPCPTRSPPTSADGLRPYRAQLLSWWNLLEEMPKATIAQIHGGAIGGAMELALACDLRVMAEDAVAGLLEARIGLIPDVGGSSRLPAIVGLGNAKEMIMTGKLIDGREAHGSASPTGSRPPRSWTPPPISW